MGGGGGGHLFEAGRLLTFSAFLDGRLFEVGANSRLSSYSNKYGIKRAKIYLRKVANVWWRGGGASSFPLPHTHTQTTTTTTIPTSVKFRDFEELIFVSFQQITFKPGNFINLKALFSVVSTDFP